MVTLTDVNEVKWFIMGLERYIGLIEGLNIGESAELIGYAPNVSSGARERFFQPATLILDGAEYNIGPLSAAANAWEQPPASFPQKGGRAQPLTQAGPVQTVPVQPQAVPGAVQTMGGFPYQVVPGTVQTTGGFPYQPIIIQPAPSPPREKRGKQPWSHPHNSQWAPHYGAMGKEPDSSFWSQNDDVWW
jgi:hypothetical protein